MNQVVILSAARKPCGRFGGVCKDPSAVERGAVGDSEAVAQAGMAAAHNEPIILGNCEVDP